MNTVSYKCRAFGL